MNAEPGTAREAIRADVVDSLSGDGRETDAVLGTVAPEAARDMLDLDVPGDLVEHYWVRKPFAHVLVTEDTEESERYYRFVEPRMDDVERYVRQDLATTVRRRLLDSGLERGEMDEAAFEERVTDIVAEEAASLPAVTRHKLRYYFRRDFRGFGAIDPVMRDPNVEDVSCNGDDVPMFVYHGDYGNLETGTRFGEERLESLALKLAQRAGRHLSASTPLLTTTLPDGSRLQVSLGGDVAARGSNFTVRKFREEPFTPVELVNYGTFSLAQMAYLWLCIEHNKSVLFVGPTASGKTTSMNATTMFIPPDHKVVSIEETREINLPHENWVADVTREADLGQDRPGVDTYTLLSEALHQRPDHILVGEIRTDPAVVRTFFQAVGTGHAGFTTFHAESARDALRRLRHDPLSVPDELLTDIDIISTQRLLTLGDERVRRTRGLTELREAEDGTPALREVFTHDPADDAVEQVESSAVLGEVAEAQGWSTADLETELRRRRRVLGALLAEGTTGYETVTRWLFRFARDPERTMDDLGVADADSETSRTALDAGPYGGDPIRFADGD